MGQKIRKNLIWLLSFSSMLLSCDASNRNLWEWDSSYDPAKLNIKLRSDSENYRRVSARFNETDKGWIEEGRWESQGSADRNQAWIFVATLFTQVFNKENVEDIQSLVKRYSGNSYLEFGQQGKLNSKSGPVEYQFYRASGQACVFTVKYWSDPMLKGYFVGIISYDWIAGDSFIYTYYCRSKGPDLTLVDLNNFLGNISVDNIVWPDNLLQEDKNL